MLVFALKYVCFTYTLFIIEFSYVMASKNGPRAVGSDGFDFEHRQKVANQYHVSVVNKSRLKSCIFLHFLLFLLMCLKLSQDVLDRLDVFIMEIEELEIPKPLTWEYIWTSSVLLAFVGLAAVRRNRVGQLKAYVLGTILLALCPAIYAAAYYASDLCTVLTSTGDWNRVQRWGGRYPLAVLWYIFLAVAFQVHVFSLYFSQRLINAWKAKGVQTGATSVSTLAAGTRKTQ